MAHGIEKKRKLRNRVRRLRGQLDALERALDAEEGCVDVMRLLSAVRGAITALMAEVVEDHVLRHTIRPEGKAARAQQDSLEELLDVLRTYVG